MDRHRVELAILASLGLVWAFCFTLFVREAARGGAPQAHLLVGPPADAESYPVVARLRPGYPADPEGARVGDRLIRIGGVDLRGAMPWTVYAATFAEASDGRVAVTYEREGRRGRAIERLLPDGNPWREAAGALVFAVTAFLVLIRAPDSLMVRSFAAATLMWTLTWLRFQGSDPLHTELYLAVRAVAGSLWAPLMIRAAFHFPDGARPRGTRLPLWPWAFAILGLTWTSKWLGIPFSHEFGTRANPAIGILVILAVLLVATRNYRRASAFGRRQVRWVLLGAYLGTAPVLLGNAAAAVWPELAEWWHASQAALVAIPISILIAVTHSNLLDVDRLISGTASYTILLLVLGGGLFSLVSWLGAEASNAAGVPATAIHVGAGAILAFSLIRLEPLLRPHVERAFFSERHALQSGIDQLVTEIGNTRAVETIAILVGQRLSSLLRPVSCVIYSRGDDVFAPLYARGSALTPHFGLDSPLLATLASRVSAVDLEHRSLTLMRANASDRAVLGSLGAAVLVPVAREQELAACVVLGRKNSGDIYTTTDLALLGVVGSTLAAAIARLDGEALLEEARSLQERLRQYVPASIASRLAQGRNPEVGERIVSIFFADLRGYTSLTEGRRAAEIFALVSQYTQAVTQAVAANGGTVVEFNGDGMMAVFGAPDSLPDMEARAIAAALRTVEDVGTLSWENGGDELETSVGIGIATGPAYIGAIRSADRFIWSAIGNTTNLASRLQSMTRELPASIVIDAATYRAAGVATRGFSSFPATPIRGLRAPCDLFALLRSPTVAA